MASFQLQKQIEQASQYDDNVKTGTTIMAVKFDGGVVVGSDSRTSSGSYIVNRVTDKLTQIEDRIICCRSGSAADTQYLANLVKNQLELSKVMYNEKSLVSLAAYKFSDLNYDNRGNLVAGIIVAGYDDANKGQVFTIPVDGMLVQQNYAIGGSGSIFLYSYFDQHYKENMTRQECVDFVIKALSLAIWRDGSSGGVARVAVIDEHGIERHIVHGDQLPTFL